MAALAALSGAALASDSVLRGASGGIETLVELCDSDRTAEPEDGDARRRHALLHLRDLPRGRPWISLR